MLSSSGEKVDDIIEPNQEFKKVMKLWQQLLLRIVLMTGATFKIFKKRNKRWIINKKVSHGFAFIIPDLKREKKIFGARLQKRIKN